MFKGSMTAIVTPFKNGAVDEKRLRELVEFQIENGTDGIISCGTTGESATLSHEEHNQVVDIVIDAAKKRISVIAGTGSNNTAEAIKLTRHAYEAGADGVLMISPYYNRPTQEGIYRHFKTIAEEVPVPIILYNVPSRTGSNVLPETVARLSKISNIVGIKEATGDLKQVASVIDMCGDDFSVISGDDFTVLPLMAIGGRGVISVTSNAAPADMSGMVHAMEAGDMDKARKLHYKMWSLMEACFYETNPVPIKAILHLMGKIEYEVRQPLCLLSDATMERIKKVAKDYGLI